MSPRDTDIGTRRLVASSRLGRRIVQALPPDERQAETWVRYLAERCALVAEAHATEGEAWTFEVRQPFERICCATHVHAAHALDCDELPICSHCHEPLVYERGAHARGGSSGFVHVATREHHCADGFGRAVPAEKAEQLEVLS